MPHFSKDPFMLVLETIAEKQNPTPPYKMPESQELAG
jgi:hypothetical protein